jgi:phosphinothricin acetyltransferase
MSITIKLATEEDVQAIGAISNHYIEHSTCTFQVTVQTPEHYLGWFRQRSDLHPLTVADENNVVLGWGSLSPWRPKEAYRHSVEGSVYVHPDHHRRGIGRALLSDLINRARHLGHRTLIGGACTEHGGSLALQEALGFEHVGTLRSVGHKFDRWLDVAHTQLMLCIPTRIVEFPIVAPGPLFPPPLATARSTSIHIWL